MIGILSRQGFLVVGRPDNHYRVAGSAMQAAAGFHQEK